MLDKMIKLSIDWEIDCCAHIWQSLNWICNLFFLIMLMYVRKCTLSDLFLNTEKFHARILSDLFSMFPYFDMLIEKRDPQINGAEIYARD